MNDLLLNFIEWMGAITALMGSYFMATIDNVSVNAGKTFFRKHRPTIAYFGWILSNFLCIYLFIIKENYGMLFMNIGGLFINIVGIYQWKSLKETVTLSKILFKISMVLLVFSIFFVVNFIYSGNLNDIVWFGSLLGLVAAFLLASKTDKSYICWFIWCISNFTLLVAMVYIKMYGIAFLQLGFMFINVIGCYRWLKLLSSKEFNNLTHAELSQENND